MAYTTIDDPSAYFQTVLYTGNEQARDITFTGNSNMQPDWVWAKIRSQGFSHRLFDSVRGTGKFLHSDGSDAEGTQNANVSAFNSNGFSLGNDNGINSNGDTHVAWCWKAGTSFTNDASGTGIGTIDSAGSFNNDSGFSIVSYTGTGSNGTIKHGLSTVPKMIIVKSRSSTNVWNVYHVGTGNGNGLQLNEPDTPTDNASFWQDTTPTTSVFSVGNNSSVNASGVTYIAYCFGEVQGYSKFGSYTGNGTGNSGGPFIFTGFKPAWVMIKNSSASSTDWLIYDSKRGGPASGVYGNNNKFFLRANTGGAEANETFDMYSSGFKIKITNNFLNGSGNKLIYMAFAEESFVSSSGVPATAR